MTNFKMNFKNMHKDTICDICREEDDTSQHSLECSILMKNCPELYKDRIVQHDDIYKNMEKQVRAIQLFEKVLEEREKILTKMNE